MIALVDPIRIEQVVRNIVSNAIKYADRGSVILFVRKCVDARLSERFSIGIKNSGIRISGEQYKQLVQIHAAPRCSRAITGRRWNRTFDGQAVHLHQGMISLDLLPEGGSLFTVTMPIVPLSSALHSIGKLLTYNDLELF